MLRGVFFETRPSNVIGHLMAELELGNASMTLASIATIIPRNWDFIVAVEYVNNI